MLGTLRFSFPCIFQAVSSNLGGPGRKFYDPHRWWLFSSDFLTPNLLPRCYQDRTTQARLYPLRKYTALCFLVGLRCLRFDSRNFVNRRSPVQSGSPAPNLARAFRRLTRRSLSASSPPDKHHNLVTPCPDPEPLRIVLGDGIDPFSVSLHHFIIGIGEAGFRAEPMTGRPFNPDRRLQYKCLNMRPWRLFLNHCRQQVTEAR